MKNCLNKFTLLFCLAILASSCGPVRRAGVVKFTKQSHEIYTNQGLKTFLKSNPTPKIVLRVPTETSKTTEEEQFSMSPIYNAIEREFLKAGFTVRDRGLFNQILTKSQTEDYSKINELTETDLILEVVNLDRKVQYVTNKYYSLKGKESTVRFGDIELLGASAEFKIIIVKTNELAGSYRFKWAPCEEGCKFIIDDYGRLFRASTHGRIDKVPPYELVTTDALQQFASESAQALIVEMRR